MFQKASSFTSFRKIINRTTITCHEQKTDRLSQGELMIESKIEEEALQLGLESEKSRVEGQGVRSSIDSQQHLKKESSGSIPLSELILRDNGYDHLFHSKGQIIKMEQKFIDNIKELRLQTEEMVRLVEFQFLILEETELKNKIFEIEKDIGRLRAYRKSRSPIQQHSDYLHSMGKRKERLSGRLLQIHVKQNRSNMKTQCDSKPPSLPSAPVTPINQNKQMTSPSKTASSQYLAILRAKKEVLRDSISTISSYNSQRVSQIKQENNIIRQELLMLNSRIHLTPLRRNNLLSPERTTLQGFRASSTRKSISSRRLIGLCSPQTQRSSKKSQMIKLISDMRSEGRLNPREEYFLASR